MHPIYRFRDGQSEMRKNLDVMEAAVRILKDNHALLIFPEGNHSQKVQLRPLQLGCARILQRYADQVPGAAISAVPIGLNYSCHQKSKGDVFVNIGKPILWKSEPNMLRREGLLEFTNELEKKLKERVLHLPDEHYPHDDQMLKRSLSIRSRGNAESQFQESQNRIAQLITGNELPEPGQKKGRWWRAPLVLWDGINHLLARQAIYALLNLRFRTRSSMVQFCLGWALFWFLSSI